MTTFPLLISAARQRDIRRKLDHLGIACDAGPAVGAEVGPEAGLQAGLTEFCRCFQLRHDQDWNSLLALLDDQAGSTFSEVFQFEQDALAGQIPYRTTPADLGEVYLRAHATGLSGLALSGGGIRSATFNLGVVQALAELRLLHDFGYLSTVSGGGFIGGWLSKWIHREKGDVKLVEERLAATIRGTSGAPPAPAAPDPRSEPHEVQFLRRYSNYLTPRAGMFSADIWTLICTYLRNTSLNLSVLVALLVVILLVPRLALVAFAAWLPAIPLRIKWVSAWPLAVAFFLLAIAAIAFAISRRDQRPWRGTGLQGQQAVLFRVCAPLILAGIVGSVALAQLQSSLLQFWQHLPSSLFDLRHVWLLAPGFCYFVAWAAGWCLAQLSNHYDRPVQQLPPAALRIFLANAAREGLVHLLCAAVALAVGTLLLLKMNALVATSEFRNANVVRVVTFGMPVLLILFGMSSTLMIGLVGRMYGDESREWWALTPYCRKAQPPRWRATRRLRCEQDDADDNHLKGGLKCQVTPVRNWPREFQDFCVSEII